MWRGGEPQASLTTVLTAGDQQLFLLRTAESRGRGGDIGQLGQIGGVDHDAAALHLKGLAVRVAVLFLDVSPELPTSPLLQNLRLNLASKKPARLRNRFGAKIF